ncbi:nucleotidyltransferase domain-containing protein [Microbacterium sp.]|uniref:nucleotidyltransferase family protein n=1 Tax=Microbacterium sp. TaxID=51671 RepID=UPI002811907E|nr:nucleotidyltransferase domain-containing protein [Microbacterium sp.]
MLTSRCCGVRRSTGCALRGCTPTQSHGGEPVSLERLRELKILIERLAAASRLSDVRVFGSVARGEEITGSDVDVLVMPNDGATLFDIARFELDLETVLGVPVSAVSAALLDRARDHAILQEAARL